jgi:hypothetical protein
MIALKPALASQLRSLEGPLHSSLDLVSHLDVCEIDKIVRSVAWRRTAEGRLALVRLRNK